MKLDDFEWDKLYQKAENFMKKINARAFYVDKNRRTTYGGEPIVTVNFPKRNNIVAILELETTYGCVKQKGFIKDGTLYCEYGVYVDKLIN